MTKETIKRLEKLVADYQQATRGQVDLKKFTYYAITYHSTAIEGSTLTEGPVYNLLDQDMPSKNKLFSEQQMVIDHQKALVFTLNFANEKQPLTEKFIKKISGMVVKNTGGIYNTALGIFDSTQGNYRLVNVHAGARYFSDYKKVPALMKTFVKDLSEKFVEAKTFGEKCELAFYAHYQFVSIHPFADGNGRTSHQIMNYILACFDLPVFYVYKSSRISYIQAFEKSRETENRLPFYNFMFEQYKKFKFISNQKV
ncbi:MAG: Fic family protein [Prevotellaceae bacterium]|jgi:Fic family protein|nr:Fic family protein [Prevotellaceae bacterium]